MTPWQRKAARRRAAPLSRVLRPAKVFGCLDASHRSGVCPAGPYQTPTLLGLGMFDSYTLYLLSPATPPNGAVDARRRSLGQKRDLSPRGIPAWPTARLSARHPGPETDRATLLRSPGPTMLGGQPRRMALQPNVPKVQHAACRVKPESHDCDERKPLGQAARARSRSPRPTPCAHAP
jgi:hypothetical protein